MALAEGGYVSKLVSERPIKSGKLLAMEGAGNAEGFYFVVGVTDDTKRQWGGSRKGKKGLKKTEERGRINGRSVCRVKRTIPL